MDLSGNYNQILELMMKKRQITMVATSYEVTSHDFNRLNLIKLMQNKT